MEGLVCTIHACLRYGFIASLSIFHNIFLNSEQPPALDVTLGIQIAFFYESTAPASWVLDEKIEKDNSVIGERARVDFEPSGFAESGFTRAIYIVKRV